MKFHALTVLIFPVLATASWAQGLRNYLITPSVIAGDDLIATGIDDAGRVVGHRDEIEFFDHPATGGTWQRGWRWDVETGIHFYSPTASTTPQGRPFSAALWHGLAFRGVAPDGRVLAEMTDSYVAVEEEWHGCPEDNRQFIVWGPDLLGGKRLAINNTPLTPISPYDLRRYTYLMLPGDGAVVSAAIGGEAVLQNATPPEYICDARWAYTGPPETRFEIVDPAGDRTRLDNPPGIVGAYPTAGNSRGLEIGVGYSASNPSTVRGCVWNGGGEAAFSTLTGHEGVPLAVNTAGEIAGIELAAGATLNDRRGRLFLFLPKAAYGLSAGFNYLTPPGQDVTFIGMNDRGGILYGEPGGVVRLWSSGALRTYSTLWTSTTWSDIYPMTINRRGWIVSVGTRVSDGSLDYVLQRPWLEVDIAFAKSDLQLCEETEMTVTLTSVLTSDLTNVNLTEPISMSGDSALQIVSGPTPGLPRTLTGGAVQELKWKVRAVREGETRVTMQFRGDLPSGPLLSQRMTSGPVTVTRGIVVVNSTGDAADFDPSDGCCDSDPNLDGPQCTLRAAIQTANALPGEDFIHFDIAGGGIPKISPASVLPKIEPELTIDGTTQGSGWVELDGSALPARAAALELTGDGHVKGLVVNGVAQGMGIRISAGTGNEVTQCRIGTNADGTAAVPNRWGITVTTSDNRIGAADAGNVISGNSDYGVGLERAVGAPAVSGNAIEGNRIGTTADGMNSLPQKGGVVIAGGSGNTVGGAGAARNVIAGHSENGIEIIGTQAKDNTVEGNLIGVKTDSSAALPNTRGIVVAKGASQNRIGGASPNVIAGNLHGVMLVEQAFDNTIAGNLIGHVEDQNRILPNLTGIWIIDGSGNKIGGSGGSGRNVVSGNKYFGIEVGVGQRDLPTPRPCVGNEVRGNWIGLNRQGTGAVPNGQLDFDNDGGVFLNHSADSTLIVDNVISGNFGFGVLVDTAEAHGSAIRNNHIGLLPDGSTVLGNRQPGVALSVFGAGKAHCTIGGTQPGEGNRIVGNGECGVYLAGARFTATPTPVIGNAIYGSPKRAIALADVRPENDPGDADSGPNGLQNFPRLRGAANLNGQTEVLVDLKSFAPTTGVRLEIFRHHTGDSSPGGESLIQTAALLSGTAPGDRYDVTVPLQPVGQWLTCTATTVAGATSEVSNAVRVLAGADGDGDGVTDDEENAGSASRSVGAPAAGDRNGDGVPDAQQANVASATWIDGTRATVVGPAGALIDRPYVAESPGRLPSGLCPAGGAVGFTLGGATGQTKIQVWIPSTMAPTTVWLKNGSAWVPMTVLANTIVGQLRCLDLEAAAPSDGEWFVAFGVVCPPIAPPQITVGSPIEVFPGAVASVPLATVFDTGDARPAIPAVPTKVRPVTIGPVPPAAELWLQSSPDLVNWLDAARPPDTAIPWTIFSADPVRFYRWRQE